MSRDIAEVVEAYLSDDPADWAGLASDVRWRRLQLLMLRQILLELREVKRLLSSQAETER